MSEETASTEPVEPAVPPPEPAPPLPEPTPAPELAPEPEPKPAIGSDTVPRDVFLKRVDQLSSQRAEAVERARQLEAKLAESQALFERLQQPQPAADPTKPADPTTHRPARAAAPPSQDFDAAVNARAEQLQLYRQTEAIVSKGYQEFGRESFDQTKALLNSFGCASDEFVADVLAVAHDEAHKLFHEIARNPDKAVSLASLSPRQRIMELTRMTAPVPKATPAVAPTNPISRAPVPAPVPRATAPAPEIDPATPEGDAKMTDEEWGRWFNREGRKRLKMFA